MTAYFTRRLLGAILSLFCIAFILHTIIWTILVNPRDVLREINCRRSPCIDHFVYSRDYTNAELHLDQPFPVGYFLWLFDPAGTVEYAPRAPLRRLPPDLDISFLGYRLAGSGLLTGDFGVSTVVRKGVPALNLYGAELPSALDFVLRLLFPGMALATLQRLGHRPHSHRPYRPTIPMSAYLLSVPNTHL